MPKKLSFGKTKKTKPSRKEPSLFDSLEDSEDLESPPESYRSTVTVTRNARNKNQHKTKRVDGRRGYTSEEARQELFEEINDREKRRKETLREIPIFDPRQIDWERRLSCFDLRTFCETYLSAMFYLDWSDDQLTFVQDIERVAKHGGKHARAMPRGGGKTALARAGVLWCTSWGIRTFPFIIGASDPKAHKNLDAVKTHWITNRLLQQDFPEIGLSTSMLGGNRWHRAAGQRFNGYEAHVKWQADEIRYPIFILPKEVGEAYLRPPRGDGKPGCMDLSKYGIDHPLVTWNDDYQGYLTCNSGVTIRIAGITGSIRGEAEIHPVTLTQPRPDIVLADDVQKDQNAESPTACDKIINLMDGAVEGLSGPDTSIAVLFPCTVIREGDVSSTYLNPDLKPDYTGSRGSMVLSWPPGIEDTVLNPEVPAAKHWEEYSKIRITSLRLHKDIRLATEYYREHQEEMDENFRVSWPQRYDKKKEISGQQHAMEKRFTSLAGFLAEYQNRPLVMDETHGFHMITSDECAHKVTNHPRLVVPLDHQWTVAHIDLQDEILFWSIYSASPDFTCHLVACGTFPQVNAFTFTKNQTQGWSYLSKLFFKRYPDQQSKAYREKSKGQLKAPMDAKLYHALTQCVDYLLSLPLHRDDEQGTNVSLSRIGIDARKWTDVVKMFIRNQSGAKIVGSDNHVPVGLLFPVQGTFFPPTRKQLEEYTKQKHELYEDQINPNVGEVKWVVRPDPSGLPVLVTDVNRLKDFFHGRLSTPIGGPGALTLHQASPEVHGMYANHVCLSEYPEPVTARGITKNQWNVRDGRPDNDYLDNGVACMALLSMCGAKLANPDATPSQPRRRKSVRELWEEKHGKVRK